MDSWEAPGERPEAVWKRFGSSRGAFEAFSESVFQPKKQLLAISNQGREVFFNSRKHTLFSRQVEHKAHPTKKHPMQFCLL